MNSKLLIAGTMAAAMFATSAQAVVTYDVSSTSVTNCSGSPHGLWTNSEFGGACGNFFDIQSGTQFTLFNDAADKSTWTATLSGTAVNPQSKTATIDLFFSGFQETSVHYKQEGGVAYDPGADSPDLDFFTNVRGIINIDGTDFAIDRFVGDYTFQFGMGGNAKSATELGGSAWIQGDFNSHHWDLNLKFAEVPEPSTLALFGLGILTMAGMRKRKA